jgi:hypothetical protein
VNELRQNFVAVKEKYQVKISNSFTAFENCDVMWISAGLGKVLERMSKLHPKRKMKT